MPGLVAAGAHTAAAGALLGRLAEAHRQGPGPEAALRVPVLAALGALRIDPALAEKVLGAALEARGRPLLPRARCDSMGPPGHAARGVADRQGGCAAEGRRGKSEGGGRVVSFGGDRDRRRAGAMGQQPAASAASGRGLSNACAGHP